MQIFRLALITIVVLALVNPTEAWRRRRIRIRIRARRVVDKVKEPIKKVLCKVVYGIGCPRYVGKAAIATAGSGGFAIAAGAVVGYYGMKECHTRRKECKRSVESGEIMLAFSDKFSDYDQNEDELISYEEFVFTVMEHFPMASPEELREPFLSADLNDDDYLDIDEFKVAPFLFKDYDLSENDMNTSMPTVNPTSTISNET